MSDAFLQLQWDTLLLETTFLGVFLSATSHGFSFFHVFPSQVQNPSPFLLFAVWWLLFRLMFGSGIVKLSSRDPTWAKLEAMQYHYQTQPIPGPLSHWMHHRSYSFHVKETLGTFFIEIGLPILIFGNRLSQVIGTR